MSLGWEGQGAPVNLSPKFPPSLETGEVRDWFGMGGIKDYPIPQPCSEFGTGSSEFGTVRSEFGFMSSEFEIVGSEFGTNPPCPKILEPRAPGRATRGPGTEVPGCSALQGKRDIPGALEWRNT